MGSEDAVKPHAATTVGNKFLVLATVTQVVVIVLFGIFTTGTQLAHKDAVQDIQQYNNYLGVTLMMFIGFGYLMTFLKQYGLGAVGLTMFITGLGMQVSMIVQHIFQHVIIPGHFAKLEMNFLIFVEGDFGVATFLISFGGLIGKVNPAQLVVLVVLEAIFYNANAQFLMFNWLEVDDAGGSIVIHMFGAYFGLAAAWVLGMPAKMEKEGPSLVSDLTAFIGTLFLWLYWPSFVAGWIPAGSVEWDTALSNTVMALLGSTVFSFIASAALSGKIFRPVDIQNATLAGGVAIGATANLNVTPVGALLIGAAGGLVSVLGYVFVQPFLLAKIGLHDTCGIHNLHGMPSLLGGIVGIFVALFPRAYPGYPGDVGNLLNQIIAVLLTMVISIATGLLTGLAMKPLKDDAEGFNDAEFWEVAEERDTQTQNV